MSTSQPSQPSQPDTSSTIAAVVEWLFTHARLINDTGKLNEAIAIRLREAGLPITRYSNYVPGLHPQVSAFSALWEEGKGMLQREHRSEHGGREQLLLSPLYKAFNEGIGSRYCLLTPAGDTEAPIVAELRAEGMTDYVVLPLYFADGSYKAMTFATRAPDGFSDAHVEILNGLASALSATVETHYLRHLASVLMNTYVGPVAGQKVLAGSIKRGMSETIHAVIWFCDLKGFTRLSENLPSDVLLEILNSYFDVMMDAIDAEGGEVLKFIGDAVLAIFQPDADGAQMAAKRALTAAQSAVAELVVVNDKRRNCELPLIECGIALHFGDVLYGNVGGKKRLDFTVIGPAVNLASRIEALTRELKHPVLVSSVFADVHGGAFENLGEFLFKGISERKTVFAPPKK